MRRLITVILPTLLILTGMTSLAATPIAEPKVQIVATAGFDGRASLDKWAPVDVEITNLGGPATGRLVARQVRGSGSPVTEYSMPLAMPEGAKKRLTLFVPAQPGGGGVEVTFNSDAMRPLATAQAALQVGGPDDLLVGVLSREPVALNPISQVKLAGRAGNVRLVRLTAESFPDNITMLANFDVLAIARFDTARLSPAQTGALNDWVRRGGLLMLVGGPDWRATLAGLPDDLIPVKVSGTRSVENLPVLTALGGQELPERGRPIALTTATLNNARALSVDQADPIVAVGHPGRGTVLYFGVDLTLDPFAAWGGAVTMWETLLLQHLSGSFWSSSGASAGNPAQMARALSAQPMLTNPDLKRIGYWFLGYIALVGPVGFGLIRLLRRPGLLWLLVPGATLGALGLLYIQGFVVEERTLMTRSVSVTQVSEGMQTVPSRTYLAVLAPSRSSLKVTLGQGDLAAPLGFGLGAELASEVTRVMLDQPPAVEINGMTMWGVRGLMVDREAPGLTGLKVKLGITGNRLTGTIANGTDRTIREALVITPAGFERLSDIVPGGTVPVNVGLTAFRRFSQPVFQDVFVGSSINEPREQAFRRQILEAAVGGTRDVLPAPILFMGWLDDAPAPLETMGKRVAGTNLIYAAVEPFVDPKDYDLQPGLVVGKLVAAQGQQRGRSPRGYFVEAGALTFSLQIPDIDRSVLQEVNLVVETGGIPEQVTTQLLNWQTGKWDDWKQGSFSDQLRRWDDYLARDGSLLVKVAVPGQGLEVRAPTIGLRGR